MTLRALANSLLSSLFEPPCAACAQVLAQPLDGAVCERCWASICLGTGLHERYRDHAVDWACAVDHYDGRLRDIIHALKYERRRSIARPLGGLMRERGAALLQGAELVVPVPLHPRRQRARGFNQADDLARQLGLPVVPLLRRVRFTTSQIELPADARHQNVRNAFALTEGPANRLRQGFHLRRGYGGQVGAQEAGRYMGTVVVLVDDVSTTGATLEACARVLKTAGVKEVRALTAARVVTGRR
ncbi:MAG: ComF family protein [Vicinamibacterales bacterium]|jgi:predicted amidophosphoribosyltransferase